MRALRAAFHMAQEVGAGLGTGQVLFGTLPPLGEAGHRAGAAIPLGTGVFRDRRQGLVGKLLLISKERGARAGSATLAAW